MIKKQIMLGDIVRDTITGFEGVVVAMAKYLNGCVQFCVKPQKLFEGKMIEGEYIDSAQLEIVKEDVFKERELTLDKKPEGLQSNTPAEKYRG